MICNNTFHKHVHVLVLYLLVAAALGDCRAAIEATQLPSAATGQALQINGDLPLAEETIVAGSQAEAAVSPVTPGVPAVSATAAVTGGGAVNKSSSKDAPPLIPLKLLLGPAKFRDPQLSPDGRLLAFIQPSSKTGVNSVFVAALPPWDEGSNRTHVGATGSGSSSSSSSGQSSKTRWAASDQTHAVALISGNPAVKPVQVTFTNKGVNDYFWSRDGRTILFVVDSGSGKEDYHVHIVPLSITDESGCDGGGSSSGSSSSSGNRSKSGQSGQVQVVPGKAANLTPFKGVKFAGLWLSNAFPQRAYIGLNRRKRSTFDVYAVDLNGHNLTLHTINPGKVISWVADPGFDIAAAIVSQPDGSRQLLLRNKDRADGCAPPAATAAATPLPNSSQQQQQPPKTAKTYETEANEQAAKDSPAAATTTAAAMSSQQPTPPKQVKQSTKSSSSRTSGGNSRSSSSSGGSKSSKVDKRTQASAAAAAKELPMSEWIQKSSSRANVSCWQPIYEWSYGEEGRVWGFNKEGDALYITSSKGRDTTELQLLSTQGPSKGSTLQHLASNPLVDVQDVLFDATSRQPDAVAFDYHTPVWRFMGPEDQAEWDKLVAWRPEAVPAPVSKSRDKQHWVVVYSHGDGNAAWYRHRRGSFPPQLLFHEQPALSKYTLAATHPIVIPARDGLKLPAYLTLPLGPNIPATLPAAVAGDVPDLSNKGSSPTNPDSKQQQQQQLRLSVPLVLLVHGGPWRRSSWGSNAALVQWLANRGYAVLNVNYRGSTGYGKKFTNAGDGQWGVGSMQHDLSDSVAWAVKTGIADPTRVCIMGSSYGGYATLAGLAFTPQLYRCGVSYSGIANLASFADAMPPYWDAIKDKWLRRVGDVTRDKALNKRMSPVFHASSIKAPLLIGQGGNDVRVVQAEADAMHQALKRHQHPDVQYVLYPDEGHSLTRLANRLDFYSRAEQLLGRVLGGRTEPVTQVNSTTARVMT